MTDLPVRRALISVSDKAGLPALGRALAARGVEIVSTGGSGRALREAGVAVRDVAALTGWPEMMGGRVKTLHPMVHGALLARRDADAADVAAQGIALIDLLVVDLYPFEATVASGAPEADCLEQIDVGGPAMIRAAAKNRDGCCVVTDPEDHAALLEELDARDGATSAAFRARMSARAFGRTAAYDAAIAAWMDRDDPAPRRVTASARLVQPLRYGENPHQRAAFYADGGARPGVATAVQHQGKALSYNNIADTDAALELVADLPPGAVAIVKHANPCGAATGATPAEAYRRAFDCDRTSAFGGIVAVGGTLDAEAARAIVAVFTEVVVAPEATEAARAVFAAKPALRLLTTGGLPDPAAPRRTMRPVAGGWLVQDADAGRVTEGDLRVVTRRAPDEGQMRDLLLAWAVARHVRSNAIVHVRDGATVGIGAGQMSRLDSARIAASKARDMGAALGLPGSAAVGSAVASDAFFPFADGLLAVAEAGAVAVIQPGGSVRDEEVIAAADAAGLAMVFTGMRHFRH